MLTILFDGLAYGMILFVLACGLAVTLGLMNFVNLAHGAFAMAGGYITVLLMSRADVPFLLCLPIAFAITALIGLLLVLWKWIENMSAKYEITPERLIVRRGIVFKSIDEIELYRIKDVRMDFSLLNQWAGIGTICLTSSDETTRASDLVMRHVERAQARREEIRQLVDAARRLRGVREIDMVQEDI